MTQRPDMIRFAYGLIAALAAPLGVGCAAETGSAPPAEDSSRPSIWVSSSDLDPIKEKIEENQWARDFYEALEARAAEAAPENLSERRARILAMPLVWPSSDVADPVLMSYTKDMSRPVDPEEARQQRWEYPEEPQLKMLEGLQDAIDCGVIYFLTEDERYAICAADVLHLFVTTFNTIPAPSGDGNSGWLYRQNHLLEARIVGAQVPIIYDLIHPYLAAGGQVYDAGSDSLQPFDMEDAQYVFRTYADLALNRGLYESNWPLLEISSLIHNILALDDPEERAELLLHVLEQDTDNQPSLKTLNKYFEKPGDIWPESLSYSMHVAQYFIYAMTLLDRNFPELQLGQKYPNILGAYDTYYDLQFPNGDYPAFGDSNRKMETDFLTYETALTLMQMNGDAAAVEKIKGILAASIEANVYERGTLPERNYGAAFYRLPLPLLWGAPDLDGAGSIDLSPARPRTTYLRFAGVAIQRNENTPTPESDGLMAVTGGGAYIHGHASGIDLELYGQGSVLGIESGKGFYRSDIHENYYRLFAAHNTVISNGASGSQGEWVNLGTDIARIVASEPALEAPGVSDNHSFTTMQFNDKYNLVAPAEHERTVAVIRLTDTQGYYLDIFKAKSETEDQFHDYVYRNIADSLDFTSEGASVTFTPDSERYAASADLPWKRNDTFRHPGWHFFEDVETAGYDGSSSIVAEFTANDLRDTPVRMRAHIPAGLPVAVTRVKAPASSAAEPPYNNRSLPAFLLRHEGEAWSNPFVVVYESDQGNPAVRSVERLMDGQQFKGVRVTSNVEGRDLVQYIISQEAGETYTHEDLPLEFVGRFAVLTLSASGQIEEAYIGEGQALRFGEFLLEPAGSATAAFWTAG